MKFPVTFEQLVDRVDQTEPDRKKVGRLMAEAIAVLGLQVDEASGELAPKPAPHPMPEQRHVRYAGMRRRY